MKKYILPFCLIFIFSFIVNLTTVGQGTWKDILTDSTINDLIFQEDGVWVATNGEGLQRYCNLGDLDITFTMENGLPSNHITAITQNGNNEIWVGTDTGIAHFKNGNWIVYNSLNSNILSNDVIDIQSQQNGKIWIGFGNGIQIFDPLGGTWNTFDFSHLGNFINFELDGDGYVWAAFPKDIVRLSVPQKNYHLPPKIIEHEDILGMIHRDTIHSTINFISTDGDGKIRVINDYDTWLDDDDNIIDFGWGRDIAGIIHNKTTTDYWWATFSSGISNAIVADPSNIFVSPEIANYSNPNMSISSALGKAPLKFSPLGDLWIIHENGISILWLSGVTPNCEEFTLNSNPLNPSSDFSLYPNPNSGFITVSNKTTTPTNRMRIEIYATDGKFVYNEVITEQTKEIDLSNLKHGFYFVKIITENGWSRMEKISVF